MSHDLKTARNQGLLSCHSCHLLCRSAGPDAIMTCPRCGTRLHRRKPNSIKRTWALVVAAFIFYIPANVLPITIVVSLGQAQSDTIMSGVIYFIHSGMWPIALVIFVASIFVPVLKLIILVFLLITVGSLVFGKKLEPSAGLLQSFGVPLAASCYTDQRPETLQRAAPLPVEEHGSSSFEAPGTFVLALVLLVTFVVYYFINWKYLASVWPLS